MSAAENHLPRFRAVEVDPDLIGLLAHHFGDGLVYLAGPDERPVLARAVRLGLISDDGYLTAAGRALLARHADD
ncbi:MAG: hypothetical protein H6983_06630 [Ectothiorhodospiraceae bacterium]|nr:hypothetical protein [Chromatiales bacterium]MCP5153821.1 hypothetical protein [Ectothiorhodospiraceae bacterium]